VLLPSVDRAGATHAAQHLVAALEEPFVIEHQPVQIGGSLGIALYPEHGSDVLTLLRHADVAMYNAKRMRRGSYLVYDAAQDQNSPNRLARIAALREAIRGGGLLLYYQPEFEIATGRVRAFEALVRWKHPREGLLCADEFVPLAEQTGLIGRLTRWVLDAALAQSTVWMERRPDVRLGVNLSMLDLHDPQFADTVVALLTRHGVEGHQLCLELTESALMADPSHAQAALARLNEHGVRITIDDFGTGYSSLAYLRRLPVRRLKIDRAFVTQLEHNQTDVAIVRSIIQLGHNLGLDVVAEGVESAAALAILKSLRCDEAQGFYLARPALGAELMDLLGAPSS
jgi:predicted signal transduction protein with EAL and GGDEF domain